MKSTLSKGWLWSIAMPIVVAGPLWAEDPQTVVVDAEPFAAHITDIEPDWQISFKSDRRSQTLSATEMVSWGNCIDPKQGPIVVLADGSMVIADVLDADKDRLEAVADLFGPIEIPLEWVAGVIFYPPADNQARDRLTDRLIKGKDDSDRVVFTNGDEISGTIERIDSDRVVLETAVGPIKAELYRARALIFNPELRSPIEHTSLHAVAGFRDGSRLQVDRLVLSGDSLEINLTESMAWKTQAVELICLEPRGGRVTYLSDIEAAGFRHVPFLDLAWNYHTDRNVTGGMLRADGRLWLKGLGVHSASRLTYAIPDRGERFECELAIDDSTSGRGSVRFRIYLDGRSVFASEILRSRQPPIPVSLDINGAKRLDLIVDFADRADEMDRADWLRARFILPADEAAD